MSHPALIAADEAVLVVVDVQEKLLPAIADSDPLVENIRRLLKGAGELRVPVVVTEQYPKGLGPTAAPVAACIDELRGESPEGVYAVEKTTFSCAENDDFLDTIEKIGRDQIVLCGIETHICVLQTALDLVEEGDFVYAVADAVGSRSPFNRDAALERMRQNGVQTPVTESVLYEMLHDCRHEAFKTICRLIK